MLELLPLAETAQLPIDFAQSPEATETLSMAADWTLTLGAIAAAYRIGRPAVLGYVLPDSTPSIDYGAVATDRNPRTLGTLAALYALGVFATTLGVYLLSTPAVAALWFGGWSLVGAALALWDYRGGTPLDDGRLIVEARRDSSTEDNDDAI